jgi:hypothetical protein
MHRANRGQDAFPKTGVFDTTANTQIFHV